MGKRLFGRIEKLFNRWIRVYGSLMEQMLGTTRLTASGYPGFEVSYPGAMVQLNGEVIFRWRRQLRNRSRALEDGWNTSRHGNDQGYLSRRRATSGASYMVRMNDKVFFAASTAGEGHELWSTDGTEGGTVLVKDVRSLAGSSYPQNLTVADNQLFFTADDGTGGGIEVWRSDGTGVGTVKVSTLTNGSPLITGLIPFGSNVLFVRATIAEETGRCGSAMVRPEVLLLVKDFFPANNEVITYAGQNNQYTFWLVTMNGGNFTDPTSLWRIGWHASRNDEDFDFGRYASNSATTTTDRSMLSTFETIALQRCGALTGPHAELILLQRIVYGYKSLP